MGAYRDTRPKLGNVMDVLVETGYDPAEALKEIADKAAEMMNNEEFNPGNRIAFMNIGLKANSELLSYIAAKKKSVDVVIDDQTKKNPSDMSDEDLERAIREGSAGAAS